MYTMELDGMSIHSLLSASAGRSLVLDYERQVHRCIGRNSCLDMTTLWYGMVRY